MIFFSKSIYIPGLRSMVGSNISGGEETAPGPKLAGPPVLVGSVGHRDDVAPSKLQFAVLLGDEVVECL